MTFRAGNPWSGVPDEQSVLPAQGDRPDQVLDPAPSVLFKKLTTAASKLA
jgi:hypothetical protein